MPRYAKKRTYRRRRRYGRRSTYADSFNTFSRSLNKYYNQDAVWTAIDKIKGLINSEMYKFDVVNSAVNMPDTGSLTGISAIAQGDGSGARTGNSVFARSVNLKGAITWNSTSASPQVARCSIVMDKQQVGDTTPGYTDIYSAAGPYSHLNANTVGRFKVLYTRTFELNSQTQQIPFQINLPMRHHIRYNGANTTDIQKGGLFLVFTSSQATNNFPTISYDCRLSYHDN